MNQGEALDQGRRWRWRRGATFVLVLLCHAAAILGFLRISQSGVLSAAEQPVELVMLAPVAIPKIRSKSPAPLQLNAPLAIVAAPPMLTGLDASSATTAASEARRALQAFEIRNHPPESARSVSRDPAENNWSPPNKHHPGDRVKTANGDWIVWVNADCYQVASAASIGYAQGAAMSQTICEDEAGRLR
jgi:hypothetical protein